MFKKANLAILVSGGGSNAKAILEQCQEHPFIQTKCILSNNPSSTVLEYAKLNQIDTLVFNMDEFNKTHFLQEFLSRDIDYIILAGFLKLIPKYLIQAFPNRIINIHPSLLPKYGGKGMYGMHVHQAVFEQNEKVSGPTIHLVNEKYDDGKILAQFSTDISFCTNANEIAKAVLQLEHKNYFKTIAKYIESKEED